MGTKAHQLKCILIGLAVNQDQIGSQVAIAVVFPFTRQRVVPKTSVQHMIF